MVLGSNNSLSALSLLVVCFSVFLWHVTQFLGHPGHHPPCLSHFSCPTSCDPFRDWSHRRQLLFGSLFLFLCVSWCVDGALRITWTPTAPPSISHFSLSTLFIRPWLFAQASMLPLLRRPSLKELLRPTREAMVCKMDLSHKRVMRDGGVLRIQPLQVWKRRCAVDRMFLDGGVVYTSILCRHLYVQDRLPTRRTCLLMSKTLWTSRGHRCQPFSLPCTCLRFCRAYVGVSNPTAGRFFMCAVVAQQSQECSGLYRFDFTATYASSKVENGFCLLFFFFCSLSQS